MSDETMPLQVEVENALSYLLASADHRRSTSSHDVPLTYFHAVEPFSSSIMAAFPHDRLRFPSDSHRMFPDLAKRLERTLDVSVMNNGGYDDEARVKFGLMRIRTVPASHLRGRVNGAGEVNIELTNAICFRDATYQASRSYLGTVGGRFRLLETLDQRVGRLTREGRGETERVANFIVNVAVTRHYAWGVRLGYIGTPSLNLMTDPTGVAELLRCRDGGEKGKRAAVLHWVRDHWRRKRADSDAFVKVRAHLRGRTRFEWDGMHCEIVPSNADLESFEKGGGAVLAPWDREQAST